MSGLYAKDYGSPKLQCFAGGNYTQLDVLLAETVVLKKPSHRIRFHLRTGSVLQSSKQQNPGYMGSESAKSRGADLMEKASTSTQNLLIKPLT